MGTIKDQVSSYTSPKAERDISLIRRAISNVNSRYDAFSKNGQDRTDIIRKSSVSSAYDENFEATLCRVFSDVGASRALHTALDANKIARVQEWRYMANYAECNDAMDEISDECLNWDIEGKAIKLKIDQEIDVKQQQIIEKEFDRYISHFDLKRNGWEMFKTLLIEGELFFEHVIHPDKTKAGILGIQSIPVELIDPVYNNVQNMDVKGYLLKRPVFNKQDPTIVERFDVIPMDKHQIVYIHSGMWNFQKTFRLSPLDFARKAYKQLSFIEEAIIIYRLTRAPERLIFDVDVGTMPPAKAEEYLQRVMNRFWSSKSFDLDYSDVTQKANPMSMTDNFWFARRTGSEGTKVTQLAGGQNLGELQDLQWFQQKLYRALKVPVSRLSAESAVRDSADILREELKFAKYVIRIQRQMSEGLRAGFITHLHLREVFKEFGLKEEDISVEFNIPSSYFEMQETNKVGAKWDLYSKIVGNEGISKTFIQKKYLGWSDTDIMANRQLLRKDAELNWELNALTENGPASSTMPSGGGGGGGGGAPGGIPEFGGGAAPTGGGPEEAPPEEGGAPEAPEAGGPAKAETAQTAGATAPKPVELGGGGGSALP